MTSPVATLTWHPPEDGLTLALSGGRTRGCAHPPADRPPAAEAKCWAAGIHSVSVPNAISLICSISWRASCAWGANEVIAPPSLIRSRRHSSSLVSLGRLLRPVIPRPPPPTHTGSELCGGQ